MTAQATSGEEVLRGGARSSETVAQGRMHEGFDDRFIRLWRYYLSYCEGGFHCGNIDVHQVTLVKS